LSSFREAGGLLSAFDSSSLHHKHEDAISTEAKRPPHEDVISTEARRPPHKDVISTGVADSLTVRRAVERPLYLYVFLPSPVLAAIPTLGSPKRKDPGTAP
jgi:hypothetical protein